MPTDNGQDASPCPGTSRRRSSFADMFSRQPTIDVSAANGARPNAMASAMAQQSRRLSVSALGLSGSPTRGSQGASAFETLKDKSLGAAAAGGRQRSTSAADEDAVEDGDAIGPLNGESGSRPTSPSLGRRLSFGAMAYRDSMRASSGSGSGSASGSSNPDLSLTPETSGATGGTSPSSPPGSGRKDGFNWSENLRSRAQRSSISYSQGGSGGFLPLTGGGSGRAKGAPDPVATSAAPAPKTLSPKAPDHFQERILKGDFYMD